MSRYTDNQAAWIPEEKATVKVGPGPTPDPGENDVVIEVAYAAVNPTDFKMQDTPYFPLPYPFIFGTDVTGKVVQLGSNVTRFKIGQRVTGHCDSLLTHKATRAGYQRYTTVREILVCAIPDNIPLAQAAVLPLSVSTASSALFKTLKLPFPTMHPKPTGKRILIWGGSSSVGASAIQLAVAAGYTVATTAGVQNHDLVRSLGAAYVVDHKDPNAIQEILKVLKQNDLVLDSISAPNTQVACSEILGKIGGGKLACLLWPEKTKFDNVEIVFVNGLDPGMVDLDIGDAVWRKYMPEALAAGKFQPKPDAEILEGGLEKVQEGIDILRKGVSGKKIVIELQKEA
ncbi:zinc-binding oxidoreductase-like protein CipB [Amylocarpus encephaloides]|uniref:Zinc-binding oxidoreductase-like protein CipB n=1 Tax=Amylocarpus encephaloides TaxID=45428 RepID=A0A9P7YDN5_9HELO|nr:zinc-binding oxidoreductase-like protein CipB [Amylocarpus encephaloides]